MSNTTALDKFILEWQEEDFSIKNIFSHLKNQLEALDGTQLDFVVREGLTFSLRAHHTQNQTRPLFAIIDVIEGEPRWLSVCFYAATIEDPDERGDFVPGGLLGEDAFCFDVTTNDPNLVEYLTARIRDAHANAAA